MGASTRTHELMAVSDAVKSPDMNSRAKFGLVGMSKPLPTAAESARQEQTDTHLRGLIEDSIRNINSELELRRISLNFSIDEDSESIVIQVVDSQSGKVIRQIPPDEILVLRKRLEELTGIIFDAQV